MAFDSVLAGSWHSKISAASQRSGHLRNAPAQLHKSTARPAMFLQKEILWQDMFVFETLSLYFSGDYILMKETIATGSRSNPRWYQQFKNNAHISFSALHVPWNLHLHHPLPNLQHTPKRYTFIHLVKTARGQHSIAAANDWIFGWFGSISGRAVTAKGEAPRLWHKLSITGSWSKTRSLDLTTVCSHEVKFTGMADLGGTHWPTKLIKSLDLSLVPNGNERSPDLEEMSTQVT